MLFRSLNRTLSVIMNKNNSSKAGHMSKIVLSVGAGREPEYFVYMLPFSDAKRPCRSFQVLLAWLRTCSAAGGTECGTRNPFTLQST